MQKFTNHVDHVAWISRPETLADNVAHLEKLASASLVRFARKDMGFVMHIDWAAGLEVVPALERRPDFNRLLWDWLETRSEGMIAVVFEVRDLNAHKVRLEALSIPVGSEMDDHPIGRGTTASRCANGRLARP